jgi:diguanylate cyclase (GGDEF)-like protein/PAS domain S-box-containing protein
VNLSDLTELVEQNSDALEQIIDLLPAPIYLKDIQGRFINCNHSFAELWGKSPKEIIGKSLIDMSDHPIAKDLHQRDLTLLKNQGCRIDEVDVSDLVKKFSILHFHGCATRDESGSSSGIVGIVFDITARADLERKLEALSQIDELTQIPNRRHGMSRLESLISHSHRHSFEFTLLIIDIDLFKSVNDKYGHKAGDEVLIQFSELLANMARTSDTVFRYGGEEFVVLLPNTHAEGGLTLADRFREAIAKKDFEISANSPIHVTASIGAAFFPEHGATMGQLFLAADKALYKAKGAGRNRVEPAI